MCSLKLSSESRNTPNNLIDFNCFMLTASICRFILFVSDSAPSSMDWCFWTLTCSRFFFAPSSYLTTFTQQQQFALNDTSRWARGKDLMIVCIHGNFLLSYISKIILKWVPQKGTKPRPLRTTSYCIFPLTGHRTQLDPVLSVREVRAQKVKGRSWKAVWFQFLNK